jgi:hypothetical protein
MARLNRFHAIIAMVALFMGCADSNQEVAQLKKENQLLRAQIDSLKNTDLQKDTIRPDTASAGRSPQKKTPENSVASNRLTPGKHDFTLQWISWDEPGTVDVQPSEDGWFTIQGSQKRRGNKDYVSIDGLIKQISASELLFKGEIISVVETINNGQPCLRKGEKIFKTTKNRQYWRLQDMINCEGGLVTDYVDIYF